MPPKSHTKNLDLLKVVGKKKNIPQMAATSSSPLKYDVLGDYINGTLSDASS